MCIVFHEEILQQKTFSECRRTFKGMNFTGRIMNIPEELIFHRKCCAPAPIAALLYCTTEELKYRNSNYTAKCSLHGEKAASIFPPSSFQHRYRRPHSSQKSVYHMYKIPCAEAPWQKLSTGMRYSYSDGPEAEFLGEKERTAQF